MRVYMLLLLCYIYSTFTYTNVARLYYVRAHTWCDVFAIQISANHSARIAPLFSQQSSTSTHSHDPHIVTLTLHYKNNISRLEDRGDVICVWWMIVLEAIQSTHIPHYSLGTQSRSLYTRLDMGKNIFAAATRLLLDVCTMYTHMDNDDYIGLPDGPNLGGGRYRIYRILLIQVNNLGKNLVVYLKTEVIDLMGPQSLFILYNYFLTNIIRTDPIKNKYTW